MDSKIKNLSEAEYLSTFGQPMRRVPSEAGAPFDFWNYFDSIPLADFETHECSEGAITYVWEHPNGEIQHVLINSEDKNVFMVLVLDLPNRTVLGHRLLNLNKEYGLERN